MDQDSTAREVANDLLTDPDADATAKPAPLPPQTVDGEPTSDRPGQHQIVDDEDED